MLEEFLSKNVRFHLLLLRFFLDYLNPKVVLIPYSYWLLNMLLVLTTLVLQILCKVDLFATISFEHKS